MLLRQLQSKMGKGSRRRNARIVNWKDERWKLFQRKREEWLQDYMQYIYDSVKMVNPGAVVEMQNSTMPGSWMMGVTENATIASDAVSGDLYGGFLSRPLPAKCTTI